MPHMGFEGRTVHFDWHNQRPEAFGYTFKSKQEYRWAQYLTLLVQSDSDNLIFWEYEPKTFELKERYRKRGQYTPDFLCRYRHGTQLNEWHEVKTALRQKDITRFKWFIADYPEERIILVLNSCPQGKTKGSRRQLILLDSARKYVDDVIFAGPILRKLGI